MKSDQRAVLSASKVRMCLFILSGIIVFALPANAAELRINKTFEGLRHVGITFSDVHSGEELTNANNLAEALSAALELPNPYPVTEAILDLGQLKGFVNMLRSRLPVRLADLDRSIHYNYKARAGGEEAPDFAKRLNDLPQELTQRNTWLASLFSSNQGFVDPANADGYVGAANGVEADYEARMDKVKNFIREIFNRRIGTASEQDELIYKMSQVCVAARESDAKLKIAFGSLLAGSRCPDNKKGALRSAYAALCSRDYDEVYGNAQDGPLAQIFMLNTKFKEDVIEGLVASKLVEQGGDIASSIAATHDHFADILQLPYRGGHYPDNALSIGDDIATELNAKRAFNYFVTRHGESFRHKIFGPLRLLLSDPEAWKKLYLAFLLEAGLFTNSPSDLSITLSRYDQARELLRRSPLPTPLTLRRSAQFRVASPTQRRSISSARDDARTRNDASHPNEADGYSRRHIRTTSRFTASHPISRASTPHAAAASPSCCASSSADSPRMPPASPTPTASPVHSRSSTDTDSDSPPLPHASDLEEAADAFWMQNVRRQSPLGNGRNRRWQ